MTNDYVTISHYGIKEQRWGLRRYQNPDGSLTPEGRARYRKVARNNILSRRDTLDAKQMLERDIKRYHHAADYATLVSNSKDLQDRLKKANLAQKYNMKAAKDYIKKANLTQKYLNEITQGEKKKPDVILSYSVLTIFIQGQPPLVVVVLFTRV